jgi:hypothetical protein
MVKVQYPDRFSQIKSFSILSQAYFSRDGLLGIAISQVKILTKMTSLATIPKFIYFLGGV